MFNNYPTWTETLNPGEEATLLVTFDPSYHGPEGIGLMQKAIRITAGDLIRLIPGFVRASGR